MTKRYCEECRAPVFFTKAEEEIIGEIPQDGNICEECYGEEVVKKWPD